ncbi:MAG TPA: flagellar motor switch protein FliG, partial [Terricaulis sp.]|nr:flagellar motor switch protein FliG [Terricaulis sp.]
MNALAKPTPGEAKPNVDLTRYTGAERAAIVLLSLGDEAKRLWEMLDDEEIKEVSQSMAQLGVVPAPVVEALVQEFVQRLSGSGSLMGSLEQTQRMLTAILPKEKVDALMEEIRGPAGRNIWDKLANVNEAVLASYLKNEYPQTVAVVLAKVRPEHASRVLAELPEDFAAECMMRMLAMEPVQREILEKIETTLRTEF